MKFKILRGATKKLILQKKKDLANKLSDSLVDNPKRFWSFVKSCTTLRSRPNILRDGQKTVTDRVRRDNLMNYFFHSAFIPTTKRHSVVQYHYYGQRLSDIQLTVSEVEEALSNLDPSKACEPDNIPGRLLKATAVAISPSICRLFNMSLSLGIVPVNW